MIRVFCTAAVLFALTATAQTGREVRGSVTDSVSHEAIPFAKVAIRSYAGGVQQTTVLTDSSGKFAVGGVPPGTYSLQVSHVGYGMQAGMQIVVSGAAEPPATTIELVRGAVIYGKGTDAAGRGRPDTHVTVVKRTITAGMAVYSLAGGRATNDLGEYRIEGLAPGTYMVCSGAQERQVEQTRKLAYAPVCGAGSAGPESARWFVLAPGEELPLDFRLVPEAGGRIEGGVEGGGPNSSVTVRTLRDDGFPEVRYFPVRTAPDHVHFAIDSIPPGRYRLTASGPVQNSRAVGDVEVGTNTVQVRLVVRPDPVLRISIVRPAGMPQTSQVGRTVNGGSLTSSTVSLDAVPVNSPLHVNPMPAGGDAWEIRSEEGGDYRILTHASFGLDRSSPPVYVARVEQGGRELPDEIAHIDPNGDPEPVTIALAYGGGTIQVSCSCTRGQAPQFTLLRRGRLRIQEYDQQPAPVSRAKDLPMVTDHEWEYKGAPPGDYMLLAWPHGSAVEYLNPEVLTNYDGSRVNVSVFDGQTVRVNIDLVRLDKSSGQ